MSCRSSFSFTATRYTPLIDGAAGYKPDDDNMPSVDPAWWPEYRDRVEQAAREAGGI